MNHVGSSVNLHVVKDGKILLLRRKSARWMDGKLQIPGGKVEPGESPLAAVVREAGEELGITVPLDGVRHLATVAVQEGDAEYYAIQFELAYPENYEYKIAEPAKCSELVWADTTDMPDDTIDLFKAVAVGVAAGKQYIEIGY